MQVSFDNEKGIKSPYRSLNKTRITSGTQSTWKSPISSKRVGAQLKQMNLAYSQKSGQSNGDLSSVSPNR